MVATVPYMVELAKVGAPDREGFYIPTLGGAQRLEDRESLLAPYDDDPALDPERAELWLIERERWGHAPQQVVLAGDDLRALLSEAQRVVTTERR